MRRLRLKLAFNKRKIEIILLVALIAPVVSLPFIMGTQTYPIAVVNGVSMYPHLQNGDLVFFKMPSNPNDIPNGTIIVYEQSGTGMSLLNELAKPVVIHRIIQITQEGNGTVEYTTKGDNNLVADPLPVPSGHVLGVPVLIIPRAGLILIFLESPQGLVAIIGFMAIYYLGKQETKTKSEEKKTNFLGALAQMSLNDDIPDRIFKKYELAVKYLEALKIDELKDGRIIALTDWLKRGALDKSWKLGITKCPRCGSEAHFFEGKGNLLLTICPQCQSEPGSYSHNGAG